MVVTLFENRGLEGTSGREGLEEEGVPTDCLATIDELLGGVHIGGPTSSGDKERSTTTSWESSTRDPIRVEETCFMDTCGEPSLESLLLRSDGRDLGGP